MLRSEYLDTAERKHLPTLHGLHTSTGRRIKRIFVAVAFSLGKQMLHSSIRSEDSGAHSNQRTGFQTVTTSFKVQLLSYIREVVSLLQSSVTSDKPAQSVSKAVHPCS